MQDSAASTDSVLVDCHVHFHDIFDEARFLDSAAENIRRGAARLRLASAGVGCLVMTESSPRHPFEPFRGRRGRGTAPWTVNPTSEGDSLVARRDDAPELMLIAGRQVETAEGLEVLTFPSSRPVPDRPPIRDVLARAADEGHLTVIPWGFGKWWLGRGRLLERLLEEHQELLLADSGCRLRGAPSPRLFGRAEASDHFVLAGSDPLPLAGHETRAGSYGFELPGPFDRGAPTAWLTSRLRELTESPRVFGERPGVGTFCWTQVRMQRHKRRRAAR